MYHTPFRATWKSKISSRSSRSGGWVRGGWGHRISRRIEEIACRISRGFHRKEVEFPGVIKSKSCRISQRLGFWSWNFRERYKIFHNFQKWSSALYFLFGIYKGKVPNRNSRVSPSMFSTSRNLHVFFLLGIAEIQSVINQEFWSFRFRVIQKFGIIIFLSFLLEV